MSLVAVWVTAFAVAQLVGGLLLLYAVESTARYFSKWWRRKCSPTNPGEASGSDNKSSLGRRSLKYSVSALANASQLGPTSRVSLYWSDVGCTAPTPDTLFTKRVLESCFGVVTAGQCCALLGPSGAGKTTLLNILAQRKTGKCVEGSILANGQPFADTCEGIAAYVTQEDVFMAQLSCLETLQFYSKLTIGSKATAAERAERIDSIILILGLSRVKDTKVGGVLPGGISVRGVSGGEKRRLSIACALISQPSIIFLDEPTTGLDSYAALSVMRHLGALARLGHTIIASVHQPQPAIFDSFDCISLLSEGRLLYFGPPRAAQDWFEGLGYCYRAQVDGGTADWLMNMVSVGFEKPKGETLTMLDRGDVHQAADQFALSWDIPEAQSSGTEEKVASKRPSADGETSGLVHEAEVVLSMPCIARGRSRHYASSWLTQFKVLLRRSLLEQLRNPTDMASRTFINCSIGLLTGLVFYNLPPGLQSAQSRLSVLFFQILTQQLLPFTYMSFFVANRRFFTADVAAGVYAPSAYYAANSLAPFPFVILNCVLATLIAYGLASLRYTAKAIIVNSLVTSLVALISQQLLIACVWLTPNQDLAYIVATGYVTASILLSGFYIRFRDFGLGFIRALSWANYQRYSFNAIARLELAGVTWAPEQCFLSSGASAVVQSSGGGVCGVTGDSLLKDSSFTLRLYATLPVLGAFLLAMHALSYLALSRLYKSTA